MGKKKTRQKRVSKGLHSSVGSTMKRAVRASRSPSDKMELKRQAWEAGKKVYITVQNPDKSQTNRLFTRVTFDQYFGGTFRDLKSPKQSRPTTTALLS